MGRYLITIKDHETGEERAVKESLFAIAVCDKTGVHAEMTGNANILTLAALRNAMDSLRCSLEDETNKLLNKIVENEEQDERASGFKGLLASLLLGESK